MSFSVEGEAVLQAGRCLSPSRVRPFSCQGDVSLHRRRERCAAREMPLSVEGENVLLPGRPLSSARRGRLSCRVRSLFGEERPSSCQGGLSLRRAEMVLLAGEPRSSARRGQSTSISLCGAGVERVSSRRIASGSVHRARSRTSRTASTRGAEAGASRDEEKCSTQTLNLKCMTSPSRTTYSLPSMPILPTSRALASPPSFTKSSHQMTSALMKPFSKSVWMAAAA
jgi:hypothetical protein